MSQFENPYADPAAGHAAGPSRTSGMAVGALVCSLLGCCPFVTSLLGVILGGAALVGIRKSPNVSGKGMAITAIVLGMIGLVAWVVISVAFGRLMIASAKLISEGPQTAMQAATAGDTAGFRDSFWGRGAAASDAEITAFITEAESRYGTFVAVRPDESQMQQPNFGDPIVSFPYVFEFQDATLDGSVEIVFADESGQQMFVLKLGSITIQDEERGDLTFPP